MGKNPACLEQTPSRILITGANGQLGWELQRTAPEGCHLIPLGSQALDITDESAVIKCIKKHQPELVINTAAYTAVDRAEEEKEKAYAINAEGAANIARVCAASNIRLIHLSTDFVFDGEQDTPYRPYDPPNPQNVYGASKLEGERLVNEATEEKALILRTAWVYSSHGNNFVKTMLKLMGEREQLGVVEDQIGTPSWGKGIAQAIWAFSSRPMAKGIVHWTDAGEASWHEFAVAIQEEVYALGLLDNKIPIKAISTKDYPTPARRPAHCVLDKTETWELLGYNASHWRQSLKQMLVELKPELKND
ncbi:MAG: dTDP-4-dehydrorhamnose reductase [Desulfobacteraceae bacterium]|nr:dTDP-4-dehydrorhamnose reductase [Desulfobacteraceae bacterium]